MNPSQREGWPPSSGPGPMNMNRNSEHSPVRSVGQPSQLGLPNNQQQPPPSSGPVLPPPGSFYPQPSPGGPSLPNISGIAQSPSGGLQRHPHEQPGSPPGHPSAQPSYPLPSINQGPPGAPLNPQANYEREREMKEAREREARDREYDQARQREREAQERDIRERQQREQQPVPPHQNHAESIQLHQPVAVGPQMRSAIHGPNGLLASTGPPPAPNAQPPPQHGGAPVNLFGPQYDIPGRGHPLPAGQQTGQPVPFGNTPTMPQMQGPGMAHGQQQPILNDALSYLDQVKVQFSGEPNVYNQFLDIMKDFKSHAIDTPGVIRRVSSLFAGNPGLIQGFNTFLPPGYRIECGAGDDPNAIRVTTPMGTTVSPMGSTLRPPSNPRGQDLNGASAGYEAGPGGQDGNWHHSGVDHHLSPGLGGQHLARQGPISPVDAGSHRDEHPGLNQSLLAHQQQERGVSQLQNAVSAATGETARQNISTASPMADAAVGGPPGPGLPPQQGSAGMEKGGRVEFNHAISYVNKIKNRFVGQPEIYKQFLEILQTYQRESKPIQDVYAQVTHLFNGAPDLLEDFKQFLPESAAHAKAQAARQAAEDMTMLSNVRGTGDFSANQIHPSQQTPRAAEHRLPPVGNFAPTPSAGRDGKRKRADRQNLGAATTSVQDFNANLKNGVNPNKRNKQSQPIPPGGKPQPVQDLPAVSPTLVPALPEPMPPATTTAATQEELAFFDRVRKYLGNKNTMHEFLKLCNLYSQDMIDKNSLVFRIQNFIGSNPDLFDWFKNFVNYDGKDQVIENRARAPTGRLSLNNCRAYGPSYRLLPRRERLKVCSGRDEFCDSVLNDEWASHPTWASEDSGFIAHKKNIHEEGLHRIEEERHDYDINIAVIDRTIQILEPLARDISGRTDDDKQRMTLSRDLGGQSQSVFKKVATKIYGREHGMQIVNELFERPATIVPVLLTRCRSLAEQWKAGHRQWEQIWREQTQKMFWKSLDHQGLTAKMSDKRQFQTKTLQNEIQMKYEEQKRQRLMPNNSVPNFQAEFSFSDVEVLTDATHLLLTFAENSHSTEFPRLTAFIKEFIPTFFGIDVSEFEQRIDGAFDANPSADEEMEDETIVSDESPVTRGRKQNGKKGDLLRDVLDKTRSSKHGKDESASVSRATSEDRGSAMEEDVELTEDDTKLKTWLDQAIEPDNFVRKSNLKPNEAYKRQNFNLYANTTIYCFFRMFVILYERLGHLKASESDVHEAVRRAKAPKAALDLRLTDKSPDNFFSDTSSTANYYHQMRAMFEELLKGEGNTEMSNIEEVLRRYYLQTGWMLYSFDKMLSALVRFAIGLLSNDGKEKSYELLNLFLKDRKKVETTHQDELLYRKQVEKYIKDGDLYRVTVNQNTRVVTIRILKKDDSTFDPASQDDGLYTSDQRWWYYISSYASLEPTEQVPQNKLLKPFLKSAKELVRDFYKLPEENSRSSKKMEEVYISPLEDHERLGHLQSREKLTLRISPTNYSIVWSYQPASLKSSPSKMNTSKSDENEEYWFTVPASKTLGSYTGPTGDEDAGAGANNGAKVDGGNDTKDTAVGEDSAQNSANDAGPAAENEGTEKSVAAKSTENGTREGEQLAREGDDASGKFEERYLMNSSWMRDLSRDMVASRNTEFRHWKGDDKESNQNTDGAEQGPGSKAKKNKADDGSQEGEDVVMKD